MKLSGGIPQDLELGVLSELALHLIVLIRTLVELMCSSLVEDAALATGCSLLNFWLDAEIVVYIVLLHKIFRVLK